MGAADNAARARRALDRRLGHLGPSSRYRVPPRGWVRAIRDALGMTTADLGARMGITAQSASELENSERAHRARLDTLDRAARAMDCTFVYAFIPNESLEETVQAQASVAAAAHAATEAWACTVSSRLSFGMNAYTNVQSIARAARSRVSRRARCARSLFSSSDAD